MKKFFALLFAVVTAIFGYHPCSSSGNTCTDGTTTTVATTIATSDSTENDLITHYCNGDLAPLGDYSSEIINSSEDGTVIRHSNFLELWKKGKRLKSIIIDEKIYISNEVIVLNDDLYLRIFLKKNLDNVFEMKNENIFDIIELNGNILISTVEKENYILDLHSETLFPFSKLPSHYLRYPRERLFFILDEPNAKWEVKNGNKLLQMGEEIASLPPADNYEIAGLTESYSLIIAGYNGFYYDLYEVSLEEGTVNYLSQHLNGFEIDTYYTKSI